MSRTFQIDSLRKTVKLNLLNDVEKNLSNVRDWFENVDEGEEPEVIVQIGLCTQKNWCKWKENDDEENVGYGDGFLPCSKSPNLAETNLFDLSFVATLQSANSIGDYGYPD